MSTATRKTISAAALIESTTATLKEYVAQCVERQSGKKRARHAGEPEKPKVTETQVKSALNQLHKVILSCGSMLLPAADTFADVFAAVLRVSPRNFVAWKVAATFSTFATSMCAPLTEELIDRILLKGVEASTEGDGMLGTENASESLARLIMSSGRHCDPVLLRRYAAALAAAVDSASTAAIAHKLLVLIHPVVMVSTPPLPRLVSSLSTFIAQLRMGNLEGPASVESLDLCNQLECLLFQRVHPTVVPFYVPPEVQGINMAHEETQQISAAVKVAQPLQVGGQSPASALKPRPAPPTPKVIAAQPSPRLVAKPSPKLGAKSPKAQPVTVGSTTKQQSKGRSASARKEEKAPSEEYEIPEIFLDDDE